MMENQSSLSNREILPLLLVKLASDADGWLRDDTLLSTRLFLLQSVAAKPVEKFTGAKSPFTFIRKAYGPDSSELNNLVARLISRGLLESQTFPVTSDGTVFSVGLRTSALADQIIRPLIQLTTPGRPHLDNRLAEPQRAIDRIIYVAKKQNAWTPYLLEREAANRLGRSQHRRTEKY